MHIVHLSAECYPIAKVGGLGDVVGALPKYLNKIEGVESKVVMPYVYNAKTAEINKVLDHEAFLPFGKDKLEVKIWKTNDFGYNLYLIEIEGFAHREKVYGYGDDDYYFVAFQVAALYWIHQWDEMPDVIHCHDYHTGFIPFLMKYAHQYPKFRETPSVFTIHNGKYQGQMPWEIADYFPWFDTWQMPLLVWDNCINAMATAVKCAWRVNTVSQQYMKELMDGDASLAPLFRQEWQKCTGILNGIDNDEWNPETDKNLVFNYSQKNAIKGKTENKKALCKRFGFDEKLPIITFIGRFVDQKGVDVLADAIWKAINILNFQANFFILGSGEQNLSEGVQQMKYYLDDRFNLFIGYDEALARIAYAGSDFMIMPSRFEPCGLNQFYTFRYGGLPIVRTVGGLLDSVIDFEDEGGNGIRFINLSSDDILHAIHRAITLKADKKRINAIIKNNMKLDFSWDKAAHNYLDMYKNLKPE
ncbi:glycogen synthase [Ornithobacterium rhinotracheale]|uniref:Glycogen synthase n=1 Tax=Ornithobacterium rhinotracheale TaxID=28251 RepID=A0A3R5WZG9_ORNRH|nr:glycogen/starch synthase [Ornithobacterium rhinotracheale]QAR30698.1 glycogen synthase [Ornithobacterium rhinotracheale]